MTKLANRMILGLLFFWICWRPAQPETASISGYIDQKFFENFVSATDGETTKVVINSRGGSDFIALLIAEQIAIRNLEIEVDKYCTSACASYLLVAAKKVHLDSSDVISLHHTTYALYKDEVVDLARASPRKELEDVAEKTHDLYERMGGDIRILDQSLLAVGPRCVRYSISRTQLYTVAQNWVPPLHLWEKLGVVFSEESSFNDDILYNENYQLKNEGGRIKTIGHGDYIIPNYRIPEC